MDKTPAGMNDEEDNIVNHENGGENAENKASDSEGEDDSVFDHMVSLNDRNAKSFSV